MNSRESNSYSSSHDRDSSLPTILVDSDDGSEAVTTPDEDFDTMKELQVPVHPIPSMQGAFAESMYEASNASTPTIPKVDDSNASDRRRKLLDQDIGEDTHASKWRQKPGQRYHELWKLMAQISFGIYLLLNGIAKDDEQVLNILQGHVDEVDAFLEGTLADFDLAIQDIEERLKFLKTPLENIDIFDAMLEDRQFRLQIVTGNERIEHIIHRTATAMNDALKDVKQGLDATKEFAIYLAEIHDNGDWREERPDMLKVFDAMKGNAEGWYKAHVLLQTKGNHLGQILVQLGSIVAEMDKRAGEVSRKTRFSVSAASPILPGTSHSSTASRHQTQPSVTSIGSISSVGSDINKNLPGDPNIITPAIRATLPAFQFVPDRERDLDAMLVDVKVQRLDPEPALFTLQPRTYTPPPRGVSPAQPEASPSPEIPRSPPPRKRFSLKRKMVPERKPVPTHSTPSILTHKHPQPKIVEVRSSLPARGLSDSAYGSDNDRTARRSQTTSPYSEINRISPPLLSPSDCSYSRSSTSPQPHYNSSANYPTSPRSDQQHFHPTRAPPRATSPYQRPWTAADVRPTNLRSTTSMSNISHMTTLTENAYGNGDGNGNGNKVKKKRSAFGWFRNAFSLSEEEKAEFERKRREVEVREEGLGERPRFLDGRRIR